MTDLPIPSDRDTLAAELSLGVLTGAELERALHLQKTDPDFARDVAEWQARFAPMLDDVPEEHAPPSLWSRIEARIEKLSDEDDGA